MIPFRRLLGLVVPSSILGLSWFWWRWRNKDKIDNGMENLDGDISKVEFCETSSIQVSDIESIASEKDDDSNLGCDFVNSDETIEPVSTDAEESNGIEEDEVEEEEITVLYVQTEESEITDFESLESDDVLPLLRSDIEQLSVNCDQGNLDCDSEVSPDGSGSRHRNQSSCGDSAICDDYSSDALSITGSDSAIKSSEGEFSTPVKCRTSEKLVDKNGRNYRDWYGDSLGAVIKERPDKPRHWGSLPVSDSESDSECILKRSAKIGSVSLDKLSIQLTDELTNVKSQRESFSSGRRHPRQNRRRDRRRPDNAPKTPKKQATPKKSPPKKNESRRQRKKSNNNPSCCPPKKEVDKQWREELLRKDGEIFTGPRETVEYEFPDEMCGRLIGKAGRHISEFKESTGVDICIECELSGKNRIVSMTGVSGQIKKAEKILNEKFHDSLVPVSYPDVTEVVNNFSPITLDEEDYDVIVTAVVDVANFYVQVYHQDVDEKLTNLQIDLCGIYVTPRQKYMYVNNELPLVDDYCVSFVDNTWCRLKIVEVMEENRMVEAFFVDYGGHVSLSIEKIWKIRPDMLQLKPQAVLCSLHDVFPTEGDEFSFGANDVFYQLVGGNVLKAHVVTMEDDVPSLRLSYYSEERGEMMSVSEQMHLWGLVIDQSISLFLDSNDDSSSEYVDESSSVQATRCFEEEAEMASILGCSPTQFVCAS